MLKKPTSVMSWNEWDPVGTDTEYEEYELEPHDRKSLKHIQEQLTEGYEDISLVREHINYLEALNKQVARVLRNEEDMGYINDTLRHDYKRIQVLRQRLGTELERLE